MTSPDTIALFGCKSTTKFILDFLRQRGHQVCLITIGPVKGESQKVADYTDLTEHCRATSTEMYVARKYSLTAPEDLAFFSKRRFRTGFVVGWQRLVPELVLSTFSVGVFGMHGSSANLPKGRGRSPMNWSIIEGRTVFYTNLFKYKAGADDGDVLGTYEFQITPNDTGETMHFKNTLAMRHLIGTHLPDLLSGNFTLKPQPTGEPTYYPKRDESDSLIDWTDDATKVERLIRAVTRPFNGAYTFLDNRKVTIYRAVLFDFQSFGLGDARPGEVVTVFPNGKLLVKGVGGLLLVHDHHAPEGIHLTVGSVFTPGEETKRRFPLNAHGNHDLPEHASDP